MNYLLDTQILLWALKGSPKLKPFARDIIENNPTFFSAVSVWEVAIKLSRGHFEDLIEPNLFYKTLIDYGYIELPITSLHCAKVRDLPFIHHDPFDRLLIAQANFENLILMTVDDKIAQYDCQLKIV